MGVTGLALQVSTSEHRQVIEFPFSLPFLSVAKGAPSIHYKHAAFTINDNVEEQPNKISFRGIDKQENTTIFVGRATEEKHYTNFTMSFSQINQNTIQFKIQPEDSTYNRIALRFASDSSEHFLGFGEQFSHLDLKGHKFPLLAQEQGVGRGDKKTTAIAKMVGAEGNEYSTYSPIPFFLTTKNRAMFIENSEYMEIDLTHNEYAEITVWANQITGYLWVASATILITCSFPP